jgi:NTE family protein
MNRREFIYGTAALTVGFPAVGRSRDPVALVLGGGGCRGYSHIGVLRVMEREGLKPDLIVGSSAGSIVAALYAAGLSAGAIERLGARLNPNMLRDWVFPRLGIFSGTGIARFVRAHAGDRRIESLPLRFAAVATDLRNGERVILDNGDIGLAVQASSSMPGLLEPVRFGPRLLVDGNIASPVPVDAARKLGAKRVVAVDVTFPPGQADLSDPFDAIYQGFSILTRKLALEERASAELSIEPQIAEHHEMSTQVIAQHISAGEQAATAALPRLRRLFQD